MSWKDTIKKRNMEVANLVFWVNLSTRKSTRMCHWELCSYKYLQEDSNEERFYCISNL